MDIYIFAAKSACLGPFDCAQGKRRPLLCYPEIFGKPPRRIHPLRLAVEAGVVSEADEFVMGIFVGTFGPDRFVLFELNGYGSFREGNFLPGAGAKVHFDAVRCFVEDGDVGELRKVEVGAEFAIDASQEVEIEGSGDSDRVIVGANQGLHGFEHVGAEQQLVAGQENLTQIVEEIRAGGAIEVADGAAEKKDQQMFASHPARSDFAETVEIFAFEADHADAVDVAELAAKNGEGGRRDFDGVVPGGLPAGEGFEEQAGFAAAATAKFGNDNGARKLIDDFPGVLMKNAFLGSGEAVFREGADDLEEC